MQKTLFSATDVSFVLALAINKEIVKVKISFLALNDCLYNSLSSDSYSI